MYQRILVSKNRLAQNQGQPPASQESGLVSVHEPNASNRDEDTEAAAESEPERKSATEGTEPGKPYKVGRGKPPRDKQFRPGQSGNPKGRPKGPSLRDIFLRVTDAKVDDYSVRTLGRNADLTKLEAAMLFLLEKSEHGNLPALKQVLALHKDLVGPDDGEQADGA
jgi:hypothetical protein